MSDYSRIIAEIPWLASSILEGPGQPMPDDIGALVRQGRRLFSMPEGSDKFHAQLWWYSMMGALARPAVAGILVDGRAPEPTWSFYDVEVRDNYWLAFRSHRFVEVTDISAYGEEMAKQVEGIVGKLCSEFSLRPAPLWAVFADELAGAAVSAGNELMEPWRGVSVGLRLTDSLPDVPTPRFVDITDRTVTPTETSLALDGEEPDWDVRAGLVRSSCCMILHSSVAEACSSCPKRSKEEREAAWMG